jgi:Zn-dependent protease
MGDLTLQHVVLRICAALMIVSVHGGALAGIACVLDDPGPRFDGRLGLNPFRHLDLVGGLLFVLFTYGWIAPIAVDPDKLRPNGRAALVAVVAGASCATLAVAELLRSIRPFMLNMLPDTAAATFFIFVETVGQLCVSFTLFNILPTPRLTGQHLLVALWPRKRETFRHAQPYFAALFALLIATGVVAWLLGPAEAAIRHAILDN